MGAKEDLILLMLEGALSRLPPEDRERVEAAKVELSEVIARHGEYGEMAIALVGARMAAKGD